MFKNKRAPSGWTQQLLVSTFKQNLFDIWCLQQTKKGNQIKYTTYPMPDDFIPFPCWELWIKIGPPAGDACNQILKNEFMVPQAVGVVPANGANPQEVPASIAALKAGAEAGRFVSRAKQIELAQASKKSTPDSYSNACLQDDRSRAKQLRWLISSPLTSVDDKVTCEIELHKLYSLNCFRHSLGSPTVVDSAVAVSSLASGTSTEPTYSVTPTLPLQHEISSFRQSMMASVNLAVSLLDDRVSSCIIPISAPSIPPLIQETSAPGSECPSFQRYMPFSAYKKWLENKEGLKVCYVEQDGACLFTSCLSSIQELAELSDYKPMPVFSILCPNWSEVTSSIFRASILTMMKSFLKYSFQALDKIAYIHLEELILNEGAKHGIVDHALRDSGNPPQLWKDVGRYFELMSSNTAYGNISTLIAISIFCDVQIHVWIKGEDLPEIYGEQTSRHYISLLKNDRMSHYDSLKIGCHVQNGLHNFDAHERAIDFDEQNRQNRKAEHEAECLERNKKILSRFENENVQSFFVDDACFTIDAPDDNIAIIACETPLSDAGINPTLATAGVIDSFARVHATDAESAVAADTFADIISAIACETPLSDAGINPTLATAGVIDSFARVHATDAESAVAADQGDQFFEHVRLSSQLLKWKTEYNVQYINEIEGRGLYNLIDLKRGQVIHRYGGDRVYCCIGDGPSWVREKDFNPRRKLNGDILFRPAQVQRLFDKYPQLDRSRHPNSLTFHSTHAMQVGTHHPKHYKVS